MATVELFITGDQIGSYSRVAVSGKSNGTKIKLKDAEALGDEEDVFRIVITDVIDGDTGFVDGHTVSVYAYPPTSDPEEPLFENLDVENDEYNGRATSSEHLVLDLPGTRAGVFIDLNGIDEGTHQIGPGKYPLRHQEFEFETLPTAPPSGVFPCFAKGTLIETDTGPLPIETLKVGDLVKTMDNGLCPIRWIGHRTVSGLDAMAPVTIEAGALGNYRRLKVSQQHRMLVNDWRNELYFGDTQVLVAAKHLVNGRTIRVTPQPEVTYLHMILDAHEVIYAEGIPSETLHMGSDSVGTLGPAALTEIKSIFPELFADPKLTARPCLRAYEGRILVQDDSNIGVRSAAA